MFIPLSYQNDVHLPKNGVLKTISVDVVPKEGRELMSHYLILHSSPLCSKQLWHLQL